MKAVGEKCIEWKKKSNNTGANCRAGSTGFLCAHCEEGYSKISGDCLVCPGFQWGTISLSLVGSILTGLFLLHKSTSATISRTEIELIWEKVDITHIGKLQNKQVGKVLAVRVEREVGGL